MRVLFLCTGNQFNPYMLYKENYFIKAAVENKDEVIVIASQYMYVEGVMGKVETGIEEREGYKLIRVPYHFFINRYITEKIRKVDNFQSMVINIAPDVLFVNCPQIYNITDMKNIKRALPKIKIILDFSTKYINSARNFLSKNVLHRMIYRNWLLRSQSEFDKILYVSIETKQFITEMYGLDEEKMEYNSLPAEIVSAEKREILKKQVFERYSFTDKNIIFANSGKINSLKRTIELVKAFMKVPNEDFRLIIAGSITEDIKDELLTLIKKDSRIIYTGFLKGEELIEILCATDMYMQPGTISQTSQTALCCSCAVTLMECPTNEEQIDGNGFLLPENGNIVKQLVEVFREVEKNPSNIKRMKQKSIELAERELEYKMLYKRALS